MRIGDARERRRALVRKRGQRSGVVAESLDGVRGTAVEMEFAARIFGYAAVNRLNLGTEPRGIQIDRAHNGHELTPSSNRRRNETRHQQPSHQQAGGGSIDDR
jgi:hypothetical protein